MSQSLSRAVRLLTELAEGPHSLDDLAAVLDVHKTTVLRLLRTLEDDRLVFRDAAYRYHLGAGLFALSSRALEQRPARAAAAPHLAALNRETGHTVHLAAYEGGEVVYIDKYPDALLSELGRVAEQGYAVDHGEHETFINCVGVPIRDASGRVVAAASISVPDVLLDYEGVLALLPDLLKTAAAISADCGWLDHSTEKAEH